MEDKNIYETGIYQNVYRNEKGNIMLSNDYYLSPYDAKDKIIWNREGIEYLFTAQMSKSIHKFEK